MGIRAKGYYITQDQILQISETKAHYQTVEETIEEKAGHYLVAEEYLALAKAGKGVFVWDNDFGRTYWYYKNQYIELIPELMDDEVNDARELLSSLPFYISEGLIVNERETQMTYREIVSVV